MINERLFGSPISGQVRKKLEDRQRVAGEVAFGDSIEAVYPDTDGNNQADLSSRTPFVRMWTSIKLIEPAKVAETLDEVETYGLSADDFGKTEEEYIQQLEETFLNENSQLVKDHPFISVSKIEGKYYYTKPERPQVDYARKTYIVGDYNYQTAYGSVDTNASLEEEETETTTAAGDVSDIFPQELKNNPLLKPQAGITGVTSETEGTLGILKRTTVSFVVHNFEDYDKIFNKYFLKPAATIFVDFGWSSVKNLYNPEDLINSPDINKFLYNSNAVPGYEDVENEESVEEVGLGIVTENQGDLEVLQGIVVDYSAKILKNGSVDCSVTLMSANAALLNFQVDDITKRHIQNSLVTSTLLLGISSVFSDAFIRDGKGESILKILDANPERKERTIDLIQLFSNIPDRNTSAEDLEIFRTNLEYYAFLLLGSQNLLPNGNSIRTGVFTNSMEADDIYISWGYCEDIIFNQNFGFGNNVDDINNGVKFQVKMDSSNQFTTWDKIFLERQELLSMIAEEPPAFLLPEWWGGSDPGEENELLEESIEGGGSYNYINKKYPKLHYNEIDDTQHTTIDESKKRIPIREVFINIEVILNSFRRNSKVKNVIKDILESINKSSDGIFDWKVKSGKTDSELEIVDLNRDDISQRIFDSGISDSENEDAEPDEFKNMFTFNIMSPNSIIKDYNLEFKLPEGNIGNMLAVQAMSHENALFPVSDEFDNAVAMNSMDDDSLSIIYEPDNGGYRVNQLNARESRDNEYEQSFDAVKYLLDSNIYKSSAIRRGDDLLKGKGLFEQNPDIEQQLADRNIQPKEPSLEQKQQKVLQQNTEAMVTQNLKVAKSFSDYYRYREVKKISLNTKSNIMPYTLSLTTYGIGSLVPGDTFRIDYLPKQHFKNTFLQTMKVVHNINSDGWYTTLDTQYKLTRKSGGDNKTNQYFTYPREDVFLSPNALNNIFDKKDEIFKILPYMTYLQLIGLPSDSNAIEMVFGFRIKSRGLLTEPIEINNFNGLGSYAINFPVTDEEFNNIKFGIQQGIDNGTIKGGTSNTEEEFVYEVDSYGDLAVVFPNIEINEDQVYFMIIQGNTYFIIHSDDYNLIQLYDKPIRSLASTNTGV